MAPGGRGEGASTGELSTLVGSSYCCNLNVRWVRNNSR